MRQVVRDAARLSARKLFNIPFFVSDFFKLLLMHHHQHPQSKFEKVCLSGSKAVALKNLSSHL
jgi:hypothetical protein